MDRATLLVLCLSVVPVCAQEADEGPEVIVFHRAGINFRGRIVAYDQESRELHVQGSRFFRIPTEDITSITFVAPPPEPSDEELIDLRDYYGLEEGARQRFRIEGSLYEHAERECLGEELIELKNRKILPVWKFRERTWKMHRGQVTQQSIETWYVHFGEETVDEWVFNDYHEEYYLDEQHPRYVAADATTERHRFALDGDTLEVGIGLLRDYADMYAETRLLRRGAGLVGKTLERPARGEREVWTPVR